MTPVVEFRSLTVEYSLTFPTGTPGPASLLLQTAAPGSALATVRTVSLPASTRTTATFDLESSGLPDGTIWKVRIQDVPAGGLLKVYRVTAQAREIAVYLTAGQTWRAPENDYGFEEPHLFREVEISGYTTGQAKLEFFTELPDQNVAERHEATFTASGTKRDTFNVRLPHTTKGHLFRPVVTAVSGIVKVFGLSFYHRILGQASGWQWSEVALPKTAQGWGDISVPMKGTAAEPRWVNLANDQT